MLHLYLASFALFRELISLMEEVLNLSLEDSSYLLALLALIVVLLRAFLINFDDLLHTFRKVQPFISCL